jgi:hypothetical protein
MALIGDLRDIKMQDILRFVKRINKSGILIIKGKNEGEIYFKEGKIVSVKIFGNFAPPSEAFDKCLELLHQKEGEFRLEPYEEEIKMNVEIDPDAIVKKMK